MAVRAEEISSIIKERIENFTQPVTSVNVGTIIEVHVGIARIYGLSAAMSGEMLEFSNGSFGLALNLEEETVGAVVLGSTEGLKEGDEVRTTGRIVDVPVGDALIGRVVDGLGNPIDGRGPIATTTRRVVERIAPNVVTRFRVNESLQTGIK